MAARKRSTEVRREQILRAALAVVAREGVSALTVAGVARRCGLVPSALYRHFAGRDELIDALLAAIGERLRANVRAATASGAALARLRRLYDLHLAMAGAALPRVAFSEEVLVSPRRRRLLHAFLREYLASLAAVVDDARRAGAVSREADPRAVAGLFLGAVQHAAVLAHVGGPSFPLVSHARRVWRQLVRGLAAPPRPPVSPTHPRSRSRRP